VNIIGYHPGRDPSACLLQDGRVTAFVEEERLIRYKHAANVFPIRSIDACLRHAGLTLADVECFAFGYDAVRFGNGEMAAFYDRLNERYPPDPGTRSWQRANLGRTAYASVRGRLANELLRRYGTHTPPPLRSYAHHRSHAVATYHLSPFDEALVVIVDGSGEHQCTTVWRGAGQELELIHETELPHSLGWFYSAVTEYLGFDSYDGEYKVMGLAAYGRPNPRFRAVLDEVLHPGEHGFDYAVERDYIHNGPHTYSGRFTDRLVAELGLPPRAHVDPITPEHEDLAFEAQRALEEAVLRLLGHFRQTTGVRTLALGGGVAQNVKLNGRIRESGLFDDVFLFPIPSDSGTSVGAALIAHQEITGSVPRGELEHVYWGPAFTDAEIEAELRRCGVPYERPAAFEERIADLLAGGGIVGWFQGRMEAGHRALGARSILADPRSTAIRDRVNAAVKYREYWRPFCPSMTLEDAGRYVVHPARSPFMIMAFSATDEAARTIPGVVHVDGTMRIHTVEAGSNPLFHAVIKAFEARTGVPVLLNTSFNVKGEPIICSPRDALRTFWSTGLDALAIGPFLLTKPGSGIPSPS
jgi:carbamoyltransferase